ncbi:ribosomal-protein-alanine N-acetyltransferase RimI [Thermogymnomonas acidicola]|uniref:Ribosomal-protein-alanine N-acetyltransferase RimI n=1 Tax=Thermogymnomonas acidicola TaxID=399579 RepID=A0AA37BPR9_9ARCH|nr:ribosomal protein S18-alanine N-acetyltransferase [Thermogymnomonas acidicola]GGM66966.1 ribosomal-protein-alanine N-acetyltransferase RimI [Thermogymnomonas acidicola]
MALHTVPVRYVRNFRKQDLDRVVDIGNSSLTEYYTPSLIMDLYRSWPESFMVYCVGSEIVGFIVGSRQSDIDARILLLAVDARYRNQGCGSALMDSFLRLCRDCGIRSVRLEVRTDNEKAISFYRRYGFSITSTLKSYYSDASDAYVMWKILE